MDELVEWLRGQLDEDERIAGAADEGPWQARHLGRHDQAAVGTSARGGLIQLDGPRAAANGTHIVRHDPVWVLREIDAKRRLLEIHKVVGGWENEDGQDVGDGCEECGHSEEYSDRGGWCETVRLLALPYADRPGYRETWRP